MGTAFNADEIFEMAEQIERNGAKFYRDAAENVSGEEKDFLLELAAMEDDHEVTFAALRKDLTGKDKESLTFDPDGESALYLKALADSRVFFEKAMDTANMEGILRAAITAEKDSTLFYLGMKGLVSSKNGQDKIDNIIAEEMKHIRLLSAKLSTISPC